MPTNLPGAWPFFEACGWTEVERSFDLIRELGDDVTPPGIYERIRYPAITSATATQADVPAVLEFEGCHFPRGLPYSQHVMVHNSYADVVVAKDVQQRIVGTSSVMDPTLRGGGIRISSGSNCLGRTRVELAHLGLQKICASRGSDWHSLRESQNCCTSVGSRRATLAIHGWSIGMGNWVTGSGEHRG